ncbi:MAG TPA: molecular chaperone TorD, partial [Marinobacter adhaerens]|nr:molecular chaperone TorD [Marinobacter adhaerens]HAU17710.1 molecular chaperone TorD [Marinobacter adhaerens]
MSNTAEIQCPRSISEEDRARAQIYQLLGVLLVDPPSSELL